MRRHLWTEKRMSSKCQLWFVLWFALNNNNNNKYKQMNTTSGWNSYHWRNLPSHFLAKWLISAKWSVPKWPRRQIWRGHAQSVLIPQWHALDQTLTMTMSTSTVKPILQGSHNYPSYIIVQRGLMDMLWFKFFLVKNFSNQFDFHFPLSNFHYHNLKQRKIKLVWNILNQWPWPNRLQTAPQHHSYSIQCNKWRDVLKFGLIIILKDKYTSQFLITENCCPLHHGKMRWKN